jgi:hypothetical protein
MKKLVLPSLVACQVLIASCVPPPDPRTEEHLRLIKSLPLDSVSTCERFVAYEEGKQVSKNELYDEKSLRNVRAACDCIKTAAGKDSTVVKSCLTSIDAYIVYEQTKQQ